MNNGRAVSATLFAFVWISISEFVRNQYLFKDKWVSHYQSLGLVFPGKPVNGAMWGVWSLLFALLIFQLSRKFSFLKTFFLSWLMGFVMMWLVIGNLGVLPMSLLWYAVPLSLLECLVALFIINQFCPARN